MCPPETWATDDIIVRRIFFYFFKIQIYSNDVNLLIYKNVQNPQPYPNYFYLEP